jgi:ABC-type lipoprotein release transport system permease subunit
MMGVQSSPHSMLLFHLNLAFKNLWRHKRRTILTTAAIAVGILVLILFDSLISGMRQDKLQSYSI